MTDMLHVVFEQNQKSSCQKICNMTNYNNLHQGYVF